MRPLDLEPPPSGGAVALAEGVLWMRLSMPPPLGHVNVYALRDADGWTVVDTGLDTPRSRQDWQVLLSGPLAGADVVRVIVTHHHPDHIGLAGWFQARGAELWTTRTAWLFARMLVLDEQAVPPPETLDFWRRAGMGADMLAERAGQRPFNFVDCVHSLALGYTRVAEGDHLSIAGRRWIARMGEGHAPEHLTLWADDGLVLGGDQLLGTISPNLGVYATEPLADPVGDWMRSIEKLRPFARDDQVILPGHKQPFTGLPARLEAMARGHEKALDRLAAALAEPMTAVDAFRVLYRRPIEGGEFGLALVEAVAHLNALVAQGRAVAVGHTASGGVLYQSVQA